MKELSIEQKAKAYDKALERARNLHKDAIDMGENIRAKQCEIIFPELRESKDDRIMRVIRGWIYTRPASFFDNGISKEEILAWLEKQGEQKPVDSYCQENCKGFQETGKCFADGDCKAKREAESNDKNEPKFHEGDWVVTDKNNVVQIKEIEDNRYVLENTMKFSVCYVDKCWRKWNIRDAKDGDVLATSAGAFIYNGNNGGGSCPGSYCGIDTRGNFKVGVEHHWTGKPVFPATKEQRDLLFQKMKEVGYIFDFKNKESKKIETEIEIPFGAKDSELQEATYFIPKGFHAEIDNDKVVIKKGEKPTAWSKKDEKMFEYALNMIEWYSGKNEDKSRFVSDWLKSIKQRIGG